MVTGTLAASLRNSAAVSSVRIWVWVSIVRTLLISPPERRHTMRGKERLSAAANALTQAPVGDGSFRYKLGARQSISGFLMTATPARTRQTPQSRGQRFGARYRPLHGRPTPAQHSLCRLCAFSACARTRRCGEDRRGAQSKKSARRTHRAGHEGGKCRDRVAAPTGAGSRWCQDDHAVPSIARRRQGHARGRPGRHGGRRNSVGRAGCGRSGAGRLRGTNGRHYAR